MAVRPAGCIRHANTSLRSVLEHVTLADLASGKLPAVVKERTRIKDSWRAH